MKILETQSAMLTNAEVLAHIRNVHAQSLKNYEYSSHKGAKLRPLRTVIDEPLPKSSSFQSRGPAPYAPAPEGGPPPARPSALAPHGDERIPLEATLDLKPADGELVPQIPKGPLVQRFDATEALLPLRTAAAANGGRAPPDVAAKQRFWDPNPTLYTPALDEDERDSHEIVQFIPEAVRVCEEAASGRARLTKAEKLNVCNLMPRTAVELELVVEEAEERLGGSDKVADLAERLARVWARYGFGADEGADGVMDTS